MATAKRRAATTKNKKQVSARTTKKSIQRKAPVKKTTVRRTKATNSEFWKVKFTVHTLYWLIIGLAVISTAFITYNTNLQVNEMYDQLAEQQATLETYLTTPKITPPAE